MKAALLCQCHFNKKVTIWSLLYKNESANVLAALKVILQWVPKQHHNNQILVKQVDIFYHIAGKFGGRKLWRIYCNAILVRESLANLFTAKYSRGHKKVYMSFFKNDCNFAQYPWFYGWAIYKKGGNNQFSIFQRKNYLERKNDRSVDLFYYGCNHATLQSFLLNEM